MTFEVAVNAGSDMSFFFMTSCMQGPVQRVRRLPALDGGAAAWRASYLAGAHHHPQR